MIKSPVNSLVSGVGEEDKDKDKDKDEYVTQVRYLGTGPVRVGRTMELGKDIYSMLFVTCIHSSILYYHKRKAVMEDSGSEDDSSVELD